MRNQMMLATVACAALMACNNPSESGSVGENATTPTAVSDRPRPGTYSVKLVDEFIGTEDPERKVTESTRKFTAEQFASENWIASTLEGDQCRDRRLTIKDGDISGGMRCDMADIELLDQPVDLHGSYTRDGWDVTLDMVADGFTQRRNVTLQRIGN